MRIIKFKRWWSRRRSIVLDTISGIGIYWLFVEIFSYSTNEISDSLFKNIYVFFGAFGIIVLISVLKNKPRKSFRYKLRGKDNSIEIRVGDAFANDGALVVPVNHEFDMSLGGNVFKATSIQNQMIQRYYSGKPEHVYADIRKHLRPGDEQEVGKTIEIENAGKKFYLVVNSIKGTNNRVCSEIDDFIGALNGLWQYVAIESSRNSNISIPLINTQHGRDSYLSKATVAKEIINSYIENSKHLNICENLVISIHESDLSKGNIDLDELGEYLRFHCKHYRKITLAQSEQDPEKGSKIIAIEN